MAATFTANAQNIIKNGDFSTEVGTETVNKTPASTDWFFFDKTEGKTTFANAKDDNTHGNAVQIENTSDNSWYRSYVGQRVQGAEKGIYTLTFDMKALTPKTQVRVFLKSANNDKMFFLREGYYQQSDFLFLILIQDIVSAATSVGCHRQYSFTYKVSDIPESRSLR